MITNRLGKYIRCVAAAIAAAVCLPAANAAIGTGYFAGESVLSHGHWVKVKVHDTGIHQISDEELRGMGFDDPSKVAVYGYSGVELNDHRMSDDVPDDLPPVPAMRHDGKLIFYGEADVALRVARGNVGLVPGDYVKVSRNYYADYGVYFLTDSRPRLEPETVGYVERESTPLSSSWGMTLYEKEVENVERIGARYLDVDFNRERVQKYEFAMPGYNGSGEVNIDILLGMRLEKSATLPVTLPDGTVARTSTIWSLSSLYYAYAGVNESFAVKNITPSDNGIYSMGIDFSSVTGTGALDYFSVLYPRDNVLEADVAQDRFVYPRISPMTNVAFSVSGGTPVIWDCSNPRQPRVFECGTSGADGELLVSSPGRFDVSDASIKQAAVFVAFDADAELLPVEFAGTVENRNLHGMEVPHMLIVSARAFLPQAERLAQAHRETDGIDVAVVLQDELYDEFSGGIPHVLGIRRMARMLHDREPDRFRSVLLFGGAFYDNRGLKEVQEYFRNTYVPIYQCENPGISGHHSRSYATDAYVGMLADNNGAFDVLNEFMTVSVGRIPAVKQEQADGYVNKAVRYMTNPPVGDYHNRALLMSHHSDGNSHLDDSEGLAEVILENSPQITVFKAYASLIPFDGNLAIQLNRRVEAMLAKGVSFWGYSGHGGPDGLGFQKMLTVEKIRNADYEVPPFVMFATCRSLYIDHAGDNLGSELLFKENGGAIGVVGALREVYQELNQVINLKVGQEYFTATDGMRMGTVYKNAYNRIQSEYADNTNREQLVINTLCYNFVGDPEIRKSVPSHSVSLSRVGDAEITADREITLESCVPLTVEGDVYTPGGEVDRNFSGEVFMSVYNGVREMSVINGDYEECKRKVDTDEDLVYEKRLQVENGHFTGQIYLPVPSIQSASNRFTFYALSDDGLTEGVGRHDNLRITDSNEAAAPGEEMMPVISAMYLDDETFADGDQKEGEVTLYATIAPNEIGVVGMCSLLGKSLSLVLDDGRTTYADAAGCFHENGTGGGEFVYPVKNLADGHHTLTLRVSNYAGQTVSRTISFEVINRPAEGRLEVREYPATEMATVDLRHNFIEEPRGRVVVKNAAGEVVFTETGVSFPYTWNLQDAAGQEVAEGVYTVESYLNGGTRYGSAAPVEVVVNRD